MYDFLIVGAGIFGATAARLLTDRGKRCLVIEKRDHVGGNCADYEKDGIWINRHGGHIFHTNSERIWHYVNCYADFWPYRHKVVANNGGHWYSLPINLATMVQIHGPKAGTPQWARAQLEPWQENGKADNLEDWIISQVGRPIYTTLVQGYTEKQWGRSCKDLPASIIRRLPIRYNWNDDYFSDQFQGIPIGGYTAMIDAMLRGIEFRLGADYFDNRTLWDGQAMRTIYTGPLDRLFDYDAGELQYRSLKWEHEMYQGDYQGIATVNFTGHMPEYTRVLEYKHFMPNPPRRITWVAREYPQEWRKGLERYYPIPTTENEALAQSYKLRARKAGVLLGGRLATYRYINMDQAVGAAMTMAKKLCD